MIHYFSYHSLQNDSSLPVLLSTSYNFYPSFPTIQEALGRSQFHTPKRTTVMLALFEDEVSFFPASCPQTVPLAHLLPLSFPHQQFTLATSDLRDVYLWFHIIIHFVDSHQFQNASSMFLQNTGTSLPDYNRAVMQMSTVCVSKGQKTGNTAEFGYNDFG